MIETKIRKGIKKDAKEKPKTNIIIVSILLALSGLIILFVSALFGIGIGIIFSSFLGGMVSTFGFLFLLFIIYIIVIYIIKFGMKKAYLKISRGEDVSISDIFKLGFKDIDRLIKVAIVDMAYGFILSIISVFPLVGPLISIGCSIYFTPIVLIFTFIMSDENRKYPLLGDTLKEAREMMKGHYVEFYGLIFSFAPWILLSVITFGIAYIWVGPYMMLSLSNFYRYISKEREFTSDENGLSNVSIIAINIAVFVISIVFLIVAIFIFAGSYVNTNIHNTPTYPIDNQYNV